MLYEISWFINLGWNMHIFSGIMKFIYYLAKLFNMDQILCFQPNYVSTLLMGLIH